MRPVAVAVRSIERADGATIGGLGTLEAATAPEAQGRRGLLDPYIRPIHPGAGPPAAPSPWEAGGTPVSVRVPAFSGGPGRGAAHHAPLS